MRKLFGGFLALSLLVATFGAFPVSASHNGAVVTEDSVGCEETTISAKIADPGAGHVVSGMRLVVSVPSLTQNVTIPTDGTSVSITVGPFTDDVVVSWNVFGGGERDYDQPLWNGYGTPSFSSDISAYATDVGTFNWVIAGPDDPNPFVNWNEIELNCYPRTAEITSPTADQIVYGEVDFEAYLDDNDPDAIQWAVREGTCAAGTNTVFGNVDGHSDSATINQSTLSNQTFSFTGDMTGMTPGMYCFIYNPTEDAGESNIRLTQSFFLVDGVVDGGGHALTENGDKRKDWFDISFGVFAADAGSEGILGDLDVTFHNVSDDDLDKGEFHSTELTDLNFFDGNGTTCLAAMNLTAEGTWNGVPGWEITLRAGDSGDPASFGTDTIRVELRNPSNVLMYDTFTSADFGGGSDCVGSARTDLDNGNVEIVLPS